MSKRSLRAVRDGSLKFARPMLEEAIPDSVDAVRDSIACVEETSGRPKPVKRRLELTRFSFMSIGDVNCPDQKFRAQIFFELRFKDGVLDSALNADGDQFPKSVGGERPLPPAGWYMNQLDIKNYILHTQPLSRNVVRAKNDILLSMRFEGEFFENMELEHFPFDMQELSIELAINCRVDGSLPCDLVVAEDAKISVSRDGFGLFQLYEVDERCTYVEKLTAGSGALYPTIRVSARVFRNPGFIIVNVCVPMAVFVVLGLSQFIVPTNDQEVRLAVTLTIVLTASAYKLITSSLVPDISYLTFADKYVLACSLLLCLLVIEAATIGCLTYILSRDIHANYGLEARPFFFFDIPYTPLVIEEINASEAPKILNYPAIVDCCFLASTVLGFIGIQVWFYIRVQIIKSEHAMVATGVHFSRITPRIWKWASIGWWPSRHRARASVHALQQLPAHTTQASAPSPRVMSSTIAAPSSLVNTSAAASANRSRTPPPTNDTCAQNDLSGSDAT